MWDFVTLETSPHCDVDDLTIDDLLVSGVFLSHHMSLLPAPRLPSSFTKIAVIRVEISVSLECWCGEFRGCGRTTSLATASSAGLNATCISHFSWGNPVPCRTLEPWRADMMWHGMQTQQSFSGLGIGRYMLRSRYRSLASAWVWLCIPYIIYFVISGVK